MTSKALFALPLASLLVIGCGDTELGHHDVGIDGHAQFSYTSGNCLFGCDVTRPMMLGTSEEISVKVSGNTSPLTFSSSNPTVFTVGATTRSCETMPSGPDSCGGDVTTTVAIVTVGAGAAHLVVHNSPAVLDEIALSVVTPARIVPTCTAPVGAALDLTVGSACSMDWKVYASDGTELQAANGIDLKVADPHVAAFTGSFDKPKGETAASDSFLAGVNLAALAVGDTTLVASTSLVSGSLGVHVTAK